MSASGYSDAIDLSGKDEEAVFLQLRWVGTGAPVGTFYPEVSADGSQWDLLPGISSPAAGAAGQAAWLITDAYFAYLRISYVRTSGSGTCTAKYNKQQG